MIWLTPFRKSSGRRFQMGTSIFTTSGGMPTLVKTHNKRMIGDGGMCSIPKTHRSAPQPGATQYRPVKEYEVECRFLRVSDAPYRWHLGRAVPVRDANDKIVKWFGSCTDIEDQKRNQQYLEEEVRQRTEALVEANARLTQRWGRGERTQRELDQQTEKLVQELVARSQNSGLLGKMGELLQSCTSPQEAFSIVLGYPPKMFPNLKGAVILLNASRSLLEVAGEWGGCQLPSGVFEPDSCWALRTGHVYLIEAGERFRSTAHRLDN
jgi:hypothetical protein